MAIEYSWLINELECITEHEGLEHVVVNVHWRRVASAGGEDIVEFSSSSKIEFDQTVTFTPFSSLTKEIVIGWVETAVGAEALLQIDADLTKELEQNMAPTVVTLSLP